MFAPALWFFRHKPRNVTFEAIEDRIPTSLSGFRSVDDISNGKAKARLGHRLDFKTQESCDRYTSHSVAFYRQQFPV